VGVLLGEYDEIRLSYARANQQNENINRISGETECNQNRTPFVEVYLTILPPQTPKVEGNSYINNVTDYAYSIRVIHSYNYIKII